MTSAETITPESRVGDAQTDPRKGWDGYTPAVLRSYDAVVLGLSNRLVWRCLGKELLAHYHAHIRARHLDVGPGTGWFLDYCRFPENRPQITLLDSNPVVLAHASRRIARYEPRCMQADVLRSLPAIEPVDSNALIRAHVREAEWTPPRGGRAELVSLLSPSPPSGPARIPQSCGHEFSYTANPVTITPIRS
jgi:hypothetical protein